MSGRVSLPPVTAPAGAMWPEISARLLDAMSSATSEAADGGTPDGPRWWCRPAGMARRLVRGALGQAPAPPITGHGDGRSTATRPAARCARRGRACGTRSGRRSGGRGWPPRWRIPNWDDGSGERASDPRRITDVATPASHDRSYLGPRDCHIRSAGGVFMSTASTRGGRMSSTTRIPRAEITGILRVPGEAIQSEACSVTSRSRPR